MASRSSSSPVWDAARRTWHAVLSPRAYAPITALTLLADAALTGLIIWRVPYTEIDYKTYMGQARLFLEGERNYARIDPVDGTGPCVYPAVHLYVYALLRALGADLRGAQLFFAAVYLVTLALVARLYWEARAPPPIIPLLALSKRLHSIYVLRMFNDPVCMLFLYGSMYALCRRRWLGASVLYGLALGVKMNALLYLPGLCVVLFRALGGVRSMALLGVVAAVQLVIGLPFLVHDAGAYWRGAFDFSRAFLFRWTVNWRFLGEKAFVSPATSRALLALHAGVLALFGLWRWTAIGRQGPAWVVQRWRCGDGGTSAQGKQASGGGTNGSNGAYAGHEQPDWYDLCAFTTLPVLQLVCAAASAALLDGVWRARVRVYGHAARLTGRGIVLVAIEGAWNVFPSTPGSSLLLCGAHLALLAGVWRATGPRRAAQ